MSADGGRLTARIWREDDAFVSFCPELEVASCGDSHDHARAMLQEAVELFLEGAEAEEVRAWSGEPLPFDMEIRPGPNLT